ncbi:hypothetical protein HIM_11869 [Hirsutella minnesotensis 3608]|uniref:Uncharacterized protein n=1 Tax=Hirsutella minnesotensis 3608 TaxID=1043627 RepID=A0A0F7ZQZ8_9HYPO|nr:hypothetical protein HIM_11869 [Hirsutella minnesotensis 3608]
MPRAPLFWTIRKISEELDERGSIPSHRLSELRNRLSIACTDPRRQKPGELPRLKKQILANSRQNHAHRIYLDVLDKDCQAFIPFILAVSPRSCVTLDVKRFFEFQGGVPCRVSSFNPEAKACLEDIARSEGFSESRHFRRLIQSLFPGVSDETAIERNHRQIEYKYWQTSITQIEILGDPIFTAMKASALWKQERDIGTTTTDCLIALIPRNKSEDISIVFSVGHKKGLELIVGLQPEEDSAAELSLTQMQIGKESQFQCTHVTLSRVSMLGSLLFDAIQASSRWKAERRNRNPTTECLVAFIPRRQNMDVSIRITVGHKKGLELIMQLQLESI